MTGMADNRFGGQWNFDALAVVICSSIALYNTVELVLLVLISFQNYRGLYFWSMTFATLGIVPYVIGFLIEYFRWTHLAIGIAVDTTGWVLMVTGQAMVLYSRLWIVFFGSHPRFLQRIKWMIIMNGFVLHGMTIVVVYGSHFVEDASTRSRFSHGYNVVERIQMCIFCVQELCLSGIYIWRAIDLLKSAEPNRARRLVWELFSINIIIICLDIALLGVEFSGRHILQQAGKGVIYSVKLKLELSILNKLIELSDNKTRINASTFADAQDFLDPSPMRIRPVPAILRSPSTSQPKDLEKIGVEEYEVTRLHTNSDDRGLDQIRRISSSSTPRISRDQQSSGTDILYADAVRKFSIPG